MNDPLLTKPKTYDLLIFTFHFLVLFQPLSPTAVNTWPICYILVLLKKFLKNMTPQVL